MEKSNYRRIGDFIQLVDERNKGLKVKLLLGLSISKQFIPSVANIIGTDMENYKIIRKNQFACSTMQVRRDKKMPIALLKEFDEAIISQAYPVFEIIDTNELLPEYLMMWFSRSEFDRHACFLAVGGVRGSLEWEDFLNMPLPVPHIEKQKEIVREYHTILNRNSLNETLNQKLEETAQAIYKHWFVDFEFPNADGKPYKSSGGDMVLNEELDIEIPVGWKNEYLGEISIIKAGGDKPKIYSDVETHNCKIPIYSNSMINEGLFGFTNEAKVFEKSITISARGGIGFTSLRIRPFVPIVRLIVVIPKHEYQLNYIFHCATIFAFSDIGSAQGQLTIPDISSYKVILPKSEILKNFQRINSELTNYIVTKRIESKKLEVLKFLVLSKMSKAETEKEVVN